MFCLDKDRLTGKLLLTEWQFCYRCFGNILEQLFNKSLGTSAICRKHYRQEASHVPYKASSLLAVIGSTLWTVGSPLCMVDHLDIALFNHRTFAQGLGGKLSITLEPSPCNDKGLNVVPAARLTSAPQTTLTQLNVSLRVGFICLPEKLNCSLVSTVYVLR